MDVILNGTQGFLFMCVWFVRNTSIESEKVENNMCPNKRNLFVNCVKLATETSVEFYVLILYDLYAMYIL